MKYLVVLTIKIEKFPKYFIQVAQEFEVSIHPNLTDEITVDKYCCTVEKIYFDLKENTAMIYLNVNDGDLPDENEESEVVPRLKYEAEDLKQYGWWLNDYNYD